MNKTILRLKNRKSHQSSVKIVALVGMSGSGKSTAADFLKKKGFPHVYFGGVVLRSLEESNLEINEQNEKMMREKLRIDHGKDVIVNKIVEQIHGLISAGQKRIIADGLYTWTEYKIMKKAFPSELKVIALTPNKSERHKRLLNRKKRPLTPAEANARDWAEIENLEKGGPIANADFFIVNNGSKLRTQIKLNKILREIDF